MATISLTIENGYYCGFCCQYYRDMTDPRVLPCKHVFCVKCLREHYRESDSVVTCPACQTSYPKLDVDALPKSVSNAPQDMTSLKCDRSKCENKDAVSFCVDCGYKLCDTHKQNHNAFFEDDHQVLPIHVYQLTPSKYHKAFCKDHTKEVLIKCCTNCYKLICNECDRAEGDCTGGTTEHTFSTFDVLSEELDVHFTQLLKSSDDKITDIYRLDKQSWRLLDSVEEQCKRLVKDIEVARDEQIQEIRAQSEREIDKVHEYLKKATTQVEEFNSQLVVKKEQLEESRTKVHKLKRDGHITEQISQKEETTTELSEMVNTELGTCDLPNTGVVVVKPAPDIFKADFVTAPSSLEFLSEYTIDSGCFSTSYRSNGDILISCGDGVRQLNRDTMKLTKCSGSYQEVTAAIEYSNAVYILHSVKEGGVWRYKVEMCLPNMQHSQTLFENTGIGMAMTVSEKYVVVYTLTQDRKPKELVIYNLINKKTTSIPVTARHTPHFLQDGDLLAVVDYERLVKYRIEEDELKEIWTCEELKGAVRPCAGHNELIYVCTEEKLTYIISPQGEKIGQLSHDKLPQETYDISIRGDELVAVGCDEEKSGNDDKYRAALFRLK